MGDWFVGEIRLFPYTQTPTGWLECAGQTLQTTQYQALYSLLGYQYGGSAGSFKLPDLRGRVPVGYGAMPDNTRIVPGALNIGVAGGSETVALTMTQMPAHYHAYAAEPSNASSPALQNSVPSTSVRPTNAPAGAPPAPNLYAAPTTPVTLQPLNPASIAVNGGGAGHENRQPFLPLRYCIAATSGAYPPRN
jgi:microcystin-dependent protein